MSEPFRVRPWATIWRVPTAHGVAYRKVVPSHLRHEVRLTAWLAAHCPEHVVPVLAADAERGELVLADGGPRLREVGTDPGGWERILVTYAEVQLATAPHVDEILALGVPDRRLAALPDAFDELVADTDLRERYRALCAELGAFGLPDTVHISDLHDGNVFAAGMRVFDWGDAAIAQPFLGLGVALRWMARRLGLARDDAAVHGVRDAYLARFTRWGSLAELRRAAAVAARLAPTERALAWRLAFAGATEEERASGIGEKFEDIVAEQRATLLG